MKWRIVTVVACLLLATPLWAKYKIRELKILPAGEYASHQDFQNIIIAGKAYNSKESTLEVFDVKEMADRGIMPMLVVIENNNDFAIQLGAEEIYLSEPGGIQTPSIDLATVLVTIATNRPISSISTRKEVIVGRINKNLRMDFEHKFFGEKIIPPHGSDYGIVFFPLLQGEALQGAKLYLPEVVNFSDGQPLIFFEFDLHAEP